MMLLSARLTLVGVKVVVHQAGTGLFLHLPVGPTDPISRRSDLGN